DCCLSPRPDLVIAPVPVPSPLREMPNRRPLSTPHPSPPSIYSREMTYLLLRRLSINSRRSSFRKRPLPGSSLSRTAFPRSFVSFTEPPSVSPLQSPIGLPYSDRSSLCSVICATSRCVSASRCRSHESKYADMATRLLESGARTCNNTKASVLRLTGKSLPEEGIGSIDSLLWISRRSSGTHDGGRQREHTNTLIQSYSTSRREELP
ncbi:hypothetical protein PFISCL1PPCAC_29106, partial [Pristionchus fissidentatus]